MKKIMIIGLMWMIVLSVAVAASCVPTKGLGLIGWWQGEDNANDLSINQNNGALQGNANFVTGKVGKAFSFDGDGDYVQILHNANLDLSTSYTIEAWVKPSKVTTYQAIVGKGTNPTPPTLYFVSNAFRQYYSVNNKLDWQGQVGSVLPGSPQDWYHIAVTYDGSTGIIYINGESKNTKQLSKPDTNTHDLYLGYDDTLFQNYPGYFNGLIDEVSMYNKALTQPEIQAIIDAGSDGKCALICGNNKKEGNEGCDDGNTALLDGCDSDCKIEQSHICAEDNNGKSICHKLVCGDSKKEGNEGCDDGNTASSDGCTGDTCQVEQGYSCAEDNNGKSTCQQQQGCGDGKKEGNEGCDDNNAQPGDGCDQNCQIEANYFCSETEGLSICAKQVCAKDQWVCDGNAAKKQCNGDGTDYINLINCLKGETCTNGECKVQPENQQCNDQLSKKLNALNENDKNLVKGIVEALKKNDSLLKLDSIITSLKAWIKLVLLG